MAKMVFIFSLLIALGGCSTVSLNKERAAEQRKQALCTEVSTRDLPQCSGSLEAETP